jgi:hypothetical protein
MVASKKVIKKNIESDDSTTSESEMENVKIEKEKKTKTTTKKPTTKKTKQETKVDLNVEPKEELRNDSKEELNEKSTEIKQSKGQKEKESVEQKEVVKYEDKNELKNWNEYSHDSDRNLEGNNFEKNNLEDSENESDCSKEMNDKNANFKRNNYQNNYQYKKKNPKHFNNSAINFNYNYCRNLTTSVKEIDSKDLVKILIVRAHDENQRQLCETMKQTLRAMNLECNFPEVSNSHPPREQENGQRRFYNKPHHNNDRTIENSTENPQEFKQFVPKQKFGKRQQS